MASTQASSLPAYYNYNPNSTAQVSEQTGFGKPSKPSEQTNQTISNPYISNVANSYGVGSAANNYSFNSYDYFVQLSQTNAYLSQRITNLEAQLMKQIERSNNAEARVFALETQMKEVLELLKRKKR